MSIAAEMPGAEGFGTTTPNGHATRRHERAHNGTWLFIGSFAFAIGAPLGAAAYAANVTLPGSSLSGNFPRSKHEGYVVGIPADEVTQWQQEGCDHPVIGFEAGIGVVDYYSLHGLSELGTTTVGDKTYRALVKMADLHTDSVALGCAKDVGDAVTWSPSTVELSGAIPFANAEALGVPGVV